jgi:hypothetical protein
MASTNSQAEPSDCGTGPDAGSRSIVHLTPAFVAILYPFVLRLFHQSVVSPSFTWAAPIFLVAAFAMPLIGFAFARRLNTPPSLRRLAYASVAVPTLFVFLGVVQALLSSRVPDEWPWVIIWSSLAILAWVQTRSNAVRSPAEGVARWRVAHGISAAILLLYILFHITNHLFGLIGPAAHAAVMAIGRHVYRAPVIEPVLVALLLFQIVSGLRLAWNWSALRTDFYRTFQVASGAYLSLYILGHMNSVFVYARGFLGIQTDWAFATGGRAGLLHDAWNVRLVPHYTLGVFFVLAHLFSGLRVVLIGHGMDLATANRLWLFGAVLSALVALAIIAGMCGIRVA